MGSLRSRACKVGSESDKETMLASPLVFIY